MFQKGKLNQIFFALMAVVLVFGSLFTGQAVQAAYLDDAVIVSAIEEDGNTVLAPTVVQITDGDTAQDALALADPELKTESFDFGDMIAGIAGVEADSTKEYWSFFINGGYQNLGAGSTAVEHGDHIQFILTDFTSEPVTYDINVSATDKNDNTIISQVVAMPVNTTAYDALLQAASLEDVVVDVNVDDQFLAFIQDINHTLAPDCEFWSTSLNGNKMQVGLLGHTLQAEDQLELTVENWCEPEEEPIDEEIVDEDENESEEPIEEEPKEDENIEATNYEAELQSVINYSLNHPDQLDWYGFAALQSAKVEHSSELAEQLLHSIDDFDSTNATDIARNIIILTAAGYDASNVKGVNLLEQLANSEMSLTNQLTYSLLAINSGNYDLPADATWSKDSLIAALLDKELSAGGWSFYGNEPSSDITGITLLALSPYAAQTKVKQAIDRTVDTLSELQGVKGGFDEVSNGGYSAESAAMAIIGLSAVGVDATSSAFTKAEGNLIDHLLSYQMADGAFKHLSTDSESNVFATNQALLALIAYDQFKTGHGAVMQYTNLDIVEQDEETPVKNPETNDEQTVVEEDNDENEDVVPAKNDEDETVVGQELPKTATPIYNLLAMGLVLTSIGIVLFIRQRRKITLS